MICPNCNTIMQGGPIKVNGSGGWPELIWMPEQEFKKVGTWKNIFSSKNKKKASLYDVANEGYYCPTCNKIVAIFQPNR